MLELRGVHAGYGPIQVLKGVSLRVRPAQAVALLGANGAGKSTLINVVSGLVQARQGQVRFQAKPLERLQPEARVRRGLVQVPEGRQLFPQLSVAENLRLGAYTRRDRLAVRQDLEGVLSAFPRLGERLKQAAGTLSGGEQQMLALARALMARPRLLLLDEPSLGLAPVLVRQLYDILARLHRQGISMLVAEQNAHMALGLADEAHVLTLGRITLSGPASSLLQNDAVRRLYLGEAPQEPAGTGR